MRALVAVLVVIVILPACREGGDGRSRGAAEPGGGAAAVPDGGGVVEGTAVRVAEERLELREDGGRTVSLRIVPGIPITLDDRVSAWSEIPEGAHVRAAWVPEDGERRAVRVSATSRGGGASRP